MFERFPVARPVAAAATAAVLALGLGACSAGGESGQHGPSTPYQYRRTPDAPHDPSQEGPLPGGPPDQNYHPDQGADPSVTGRYWDIVFLTALASRCFAGRTPKHLHVEQDIPGGMHTTSDFFTNAKMGKDAALGDGPANLTRLKEATVGLISRTVQIQGRSSDATGSVVFASAGPAVGARTNKLQITLHTRLKDAGLLTGAADFWRLRDVDNLDEGRLSPTSVEIYSENIKDGTADYISLSLSSDFRGNEVVLEDHFKGPASGLQGHLRKTDRVATLQNMENYLKRTKEIAGDLVGSSKECMGVPVTVPDKKGNNDMDKIV